MLLMAVKDDRRAAQRILDGQEQTHPFVGMLVCQHPCHSGEERGGSGGEKPLLREP